MSIPFRVAALTTLLAFLPMSAFADFVAFINPAGTFAPYSGAPTGTPPWGMDFDVNASPVLITSLGSFDYQQDGVFLRDVVVGIYDRDTQTLVGSTQTFSTASPGALLGGSRFKAVSSPFVLPANFHGSIVAWGITELGSGGEPVVDESNNNPTWTLDTGGGLLSFVGTSRLLGSPGSGSITYPTVPDLNFVHPAYAKNQYMAGTFQFVAVPEPSTLVLGFAGLAVLGLATLRKKTRRAQRVAAV